MAHVFKMTWKKLIHGPKSQCWRACAWCSWAAWICENRSAPQNPSNESQDCQYPRQFLADKFATRLGNGKKHRLCSYIFFLRLETNARQATLVVFVKHYFLSNLSSLKRAWNDPLRSVMLFFCQKFQKKLRWRATSENHMSSLTRWTPLSTVSNDNKSQGKRCEGVIQSWWSCDLGK